MVTSCNFNSKIRSRTVLKFIKSSDQIEKLIRTIAVNNNYRKSNGNLGYAGKKVIEARTDEITASDFAKSLDA